MGAVLDTTIFVDLERQAALRGTADPIGLIGRSLEQSLGPEEEVGISSITVSELLHGVHRATLEYRPRREAFVEAVISIVPVMEFDLLAARVHASLWAALAATGVDVGAHDRIVAATAISVGWSVATANTRHFDRIAGLDVIDVRLVG